jgi:hypothetical protein
MSLCYLATEKDRLQTKRPIKLVSVLLGNGNGTFQNQTKYSTGRFPLYVTSGDFNNDNNLDLVVTNTDDDDIGVLLGNGDGTFQNQMKYKSGSKPTSLSVGDFNDDMKLDLAVTNRQEDSVTILLGSCP